MADRQQDKYGVGPQKGPSPSGTDPKAATAQEEIRKVRGGPGEGKAAETVTDAEGRPRDDSLPGGQARQGRR